jgi:hypothetical protein
MTPTSASRNPPNRMNEKRMPPTTGTRTTDPIRAPRATIELNAFMQTSLSVTTCTNTFRWCAREPAAGIVETP